MVMRTMPLKHIIGKFFPLGGSTIVMLAMDGNPLCVPQPLQASNPLTRKQRGGRRGVQYDHSLRL
jgi:hypothetical protein